MKPELAAAGSPSQYSWLKKMGDDVYTSLDMSTLEGRKGLVACQQRPCEPMDKVVNTEIAVSDVLLHPARSERPETGEIEEWTRIVLFLADGRMIDCGSLGVLKSLKLASIMFGPPPWRGIRGKVVQQQLSGQRRWYVIDWDLEQKPGEPEPAVVKEKKK